MKNERPGPRVLISALFTVCIAACSSASPRPPEQPTAVTKTTSAQAALTTTESTSDCDVVCQGAQVIPQAGETPDYHAQAVANADRAFASMHDDLLACYKERLAVDPKAHAFITVDVVIVSDGTVRNVETTGGALLGKRAMSCIVNRIKAAKFEPMPGGGTRHIQAPFAFRRVGLDEGI